MDNLQSRENDSEPEEGEWEALAGLFPGAVKLSLEDKKTLACMVRRCVVHEQEDAAAAVNIFRVDDIPEIKGKIDALPISSAEEITAFIQDLDLSAEEAEMESANWAFRHQSLPGNFLIGESLIHFRLIRFNAYSYMLICDVSSQDIVARFSKVFGREPAVNSDRILHDGTKRWSAWGWFTNPDAERAREDAEQLRQIWKGIE